MTADLIGDDWRARVEVLADPEPQSPVVDPPAVAVLAADLGLPLAAEPACDRFQLLYDASGRLALQPPADLPELGRLPLVVDFVAEPRFAHPMNLREPLARAVGIKGGARPTVIDLTAGLGRDAWSLASTGCSVVAFERQPLVHALLADGLARARSSNGPAVAIAERISLHRGDVRDAAPECLDADGRTVWLLDPMFPERRKSALVKKGMRIFQQLVGDDADAPDLYAWARRQPGQRWVVKRPVSAPALAGMKPDVRYEGGRVRFDCAFAAPA